jgi:hypothetical protein
MKKKKFLNSFLIPLKRKNGLNLLCFGSKMKYTTCKNGQICFTNKNDKIDKIPSTLKHYEKGFSIDLANLKEETMNETINKINKEVIKIKRDLEDMKYKMNLGEQSFYLPLKSSKFLRFLRFNLF